MNNKEEVAGLTANKVDIRPGVSVLAVLRHLNYKPWYALAEFVDNAVESFSRHRETLKEHHGDGLKLVVKIDIDTTSPTRISIRDNAAGIALAEFGRAFRPAAVPPDRSGLAEFGMGMKSAACWFAPQWSVRTSAFRETVARTVRFEIANIVNDEIEELEIQEDPEATDQHYTEIVLENIFNVPVGRTVSKLKEHLTDIYRVFIRERTLELHFNGDLLSPQEIPILSAPFYREREGAARLWRKDVCFDFGNGLSVRGFAALRKTASTAKAGFSLFRRGRVIEGSGDEGYRPAQIFGTSNSYRYQRLFGELHLDGFEVSHTKDGFRWDENEQPFLELLREHLDSEELPLLKQAEGYRANVPRERLAKTVTQALGNTARAIRERLPAALPEISEAPPVETPNEEPPHVGTLARKQFDIRFRDRDWHISIELTEDRSESQWLAISEVAASTEQPRSLDIRVSMVHPFMIRFAQNDSKDVEALLRVASALALGEVLARDSGVRHAGTIRRNVNEIIRSALSDA